MRRLIYIHEQTDWPHFTWDNEILSAKAGDVRHLQGRVLGKMEALGFKLREEALLETITIDVLKTTEIEGEFLNPSQVRSSVARHLGMDISGLVRSDRNTDGIVEMTLDATQNHNKTLTTERLFKWHSFLFPSVKGNSSKIIIGDWRDDSTGPMQVISGAMGKERVHYEAPPSKKIKKEMNLFLKWFNSKNVLDPVLKSGIAHLWFVTIHPFEDGNGRIARAIADMQLARADGTSQRFYSMSAQIRQQRNEYYAILERTQKGKTDISRWLEWYLNCLERALKATDKVLERVLAKAKFWELHAQTALNERQRQMVNKLFDRFEGKLSSSKWAKMNKCSADTALRDIQDLLHKKVLVKENAGGRSTGYELKK